MTSGPVIRYFFLIFPYMVVREYHISSIFTNFCAVWHCEHTTCEPVSPPPSLSVPDYQKFLQTSKFATLSAQMPLNWPPCPPFVEVLPSWSSLTNAGEKFVLKTPGPSRLAFAFTFHPQLPPPPLYLQALALGHSAIPRRKRPDNQDQTKVKKTTIRASIVSTTTQNVRRPDQRQKEKKSIHLQIHKRIRREEKKATKGKDAK